MFYYNKIRELGAQPKYLVNADFKDFTINGEEAECYYLDDNGERIYHYTTSGKGFMINLFKDCDWENVAVLLTDGTGFGMDCPINCTVYTDGVPEATATGGEMFGTDRMIAALNTCANGSPAEILESVRNSVDAFVGDAEQFDDLTMMCLEYHGS